MYALGTALHLLEFKFQILARIHVSIELPGDYSFQSNIWKGRMSKNIQLLSVEENVIPYFFFDLFDLSTLFRAIFFH